MHSWVTTPLGVVVTPVLHVNSTEHLYIHSHAKTYNYTCTYSCILYTVIHRHMYIHVHVVYMYIHTCPVHINLEMIAYTWSNKERTIWREAETSEERWDGLIQEHLELLAWSTLQTYKYNTFIHAQHHDSTCTLSCACHMTSGCWPHWWKWTC